MNEQLINQKSSLKITAGALADEHLLPGKNWPTVRYKFARHIFARSSISLAWLLSGKPGVKILTMFKTPLTLSSMVSGGALGKFQAFAANDPIRVCTHL